MISQPGVEIEAYRFERKFLVTSLGEEALALLIKLHPVFFSEIYYPRYINNIYLDTPAGTSFHEAVDGTKDRVKVRIRWYGDMFGPVEHPRLEFKIKHGLLGRKEIYDLKPFELDRAFDHVRLHQLFSESRLPDSVWPPLHALEPVLLNRYRRTYFRSVDHAFRATLDADLSYLACRPIGNSFLHTYQDRRRNVLEIKYGPQHDAEAWRVCNRFPFRMTKSSKYVMGVEILDLK